MLNLSEGDIQGVLQLRRELDLEFIKQIVDYWFELKKTPDQRLQERKDQMAESAKASIEKALGLENKSEKVKKLLQSNPEFSEFDLDKFFVKTPPNNANSKTAQNT